MSIGEFLRVTRKKAGKSSNEAAKLVGCSNGSIANYERDFRKPTDDFLLSFSEVFSVDFEEMKKLRELTVYKSMYQSSDEYKIKSFLEEERIPYSVSYQDNVIVITTSIQEKETIFHFLDYEFVRVTINSIGSEMFIDEVEDIKDLISLLKELNKNKLQIKIKTAR